MGYEDYETVAFSAGILIWCFYEYRKREKLQKEKIASLRSLHALPAIGEPVSALHLWTTGSVLAVLVGALTLIVVLALRGNPRYLEGYLYAIVPLAVLLVALGVVFLGSLNSWRGRKDK